MHVRNNILKKVIRGRSHLQTPFIRYNMYAIRTVKECFFLKVKSIKLLFMLEPDSKEFNKMAG